MRGEVGADDLGPAAEDGPDRGRGLPPLVADEAVNGRGQRLRVVAAGAAGAAAWAGGGAPGG